MLKKIPEVACNIFCSWWSFRLVYLTQADSAEWQWYILILIYKKDEATVRTARPSLCGQLWRRMSWKWPPWSADEGASLAILQQTDTQSIVYHSLRGKCMCYSPCGREDIKIIFSFQRQGALKETKIEQRLSLNDEVCRVPCLGHPPTVAVTKTENLFLSHRKTVSNAPCLYAWLGNYIYF